jgi:hypothetical protein
MLLLTVVLQVAVNLHLVLLAIGEPLPLILPLVEVLLLSYNEGQLMTSQKRVTGGKLVVRKVLLLTVPQSMLLF